MDDARHPGGPSYTTTNLRQGGATHVDTPTDGAGGGSSRTGHDLTDQGQRHDDGKGQPTRGRRLSYWVLDRLMVIGVPIGLLLLWEALVQADLVPRAVPAPSEVVEEFGNWIFGVAAGPFDLYSGTWLRQVWASTSRVLQGFTLAAVIGIPVGILIGWSRLANRLIDPTIQLARPVPITAWLPFAIAVFGIGRANALFLIYLGAFYPIVINATVGARSTPKSLYRAAGMLGASRKDMLLKVVAPSALPNIVAGMRVGIGIGWTALIVAEMIAIQAGLGYVLWDAYYQGRMAICVAAMVSVGALGFASDWIIKTAGNRLLRWRTASFQG